MARDPRVDLASHNLTHQVATGIDPKNTQRPRAERWGWEDWCRFWSEEAARHPKLAKEAADNGRTVSAAEAIRCAENPARETRCYGKDDDESRGGTRVR